MNRGNAQISRFFLLGVVVLLMATLAACGGGGGGGGGEPAAPPADTAEVESTSDEATEEGSSDEADEPAADTAEEPADEPAADEAEEPAADTTDEAVEELIDDEAEGTTDAGGDVPDGWQPFTSEEGGFSILMPGDPEEQSQTTTTAVGDVDVTIYQAAVGSNLIYQAAYNDFPADLVEMVGDDTSDLLQSTAEGAMGGLGGEMEETEDIELDGYPGKRAVGTGEMAGMELQAIGEFYLVENRLYQVMVLGVGSEFNMDDAEQFFDSFTLTNAAPAAEGDAEEPAQEAAEGDAEEPAQEAAEGDAEEPAPVPAASGEDMVVAVGAGDNRLSVLTGGAWITPDTDVNVCSTGNAMIDPNGALWVGCNDLITSTDGGQTWSAVDVVSELSLGQQLALDPQNRVWWIESDVITVVDAGDGSIVETYNVAEATGEEGFPTEIVAVTPDGTLWLGGLNIKGSELVSFDGTNWMAYGENEDMGFESYQSPQALYVSGDGSIRLVMSDGIYSIDGETFTKEIDSSGINQLSTAQDAIELPDGSVWVSSFGGIAVWDGSAWSEIGREQGLPSQVVYDLTYDAQGHVWAGTRYGLAVQDGSGGWQVALPSTSNIAESRIAAIAVSGAPTLPPEGEPQTGSVTGTIVEDGSPVAGTTVQVCSEPGASLFSETPCEDYAVAETTTTGDDGNFAVTGLPLGTYSLSVEKPDGDWVNFSFDEINLFEPGQEYNVGTADIES